MSFKKNSSSKSNNIAPKKSYHFFSIPSSFLLEGEINKLIEGVSKTVFFTLFPEDFLYYEDRQKKNFKGGIHFDFDLKIQWVLKSAREKSQKLIHNRLLGFRFMAGEYYEEFESNDEVMLIELKECLRKKLNQLNFHDYYRALKKLGKGNFASVYMIENKETDKKYACKSFSKEQVQKELKGKESLQNEILIMRKIDHSNIIHLHEVHETDNTFYMIMDYLEGGPLIDLIKDEQKLGHLAIMNLLISITHGLKYLHNMGIIHRDLKPENILFRNDETREPIIVDLGLATLESEHEFLFPRCGTPGYVAPEVINIKSQGIKYGSVCDVFSLGIIFHLLLLGKSPFTGKTYQEILYQNKQSSFNFNKPEYRSLNAEALDLLKHMLEKEPEKRITSKEILNHPYLNHSCNSSFNEMEETNQISLSENLQKFNQEYRKFNRINLIYVFKQRKKINQEMNNSFIKSPAKSPCSPIKYYGVSKIDRNPKTKETILLDTTQNGSFRKADSCISLVMRPVLFGMNFDSIEEMNIPNLVSSKKSMTIHTNNQKSLNDNESFSIWQKTNTANTFCKKEIVMSNHEKE